jgi:hypothetical protein
MPASGGDRAVPSTRTGRAGRSLPLGRCVQRGWPRAVHLVGCTVLLAARIASAGPADVVDVRVTREPGGTFRFEVSVRHADEGWEHYADRWEIVAPDGSILATRPLQHPHVDEQPFTRDLAGVKIPDGITRVTVRAHDSRHGFGGKELSVQLPRADGSPAAP